MGKSDCYEHWPPGHIAGVLSDYRHQIWYQKDHCLWHVCQQLTWNDPIHVAVAGSSDGQRYRSTRVLETNTHTCMQSHLCDTVMVFKHVVLAVTKEILCGPIAKHALWVSDDIGPDSSSRFCCWEPNIYINQPKLTMSRRRPRNWILIFARTLVQY